MALLTLGINHRTAPVEIRERVAFTPERMAEAFSELRAASGAGEAAILSTCNRTELYLAGDDDCAPTVLRWLAGFHELDVADRSEEHTSELQSRPHLVCRLLPEKKKPPHDRPRPPRRAGARPAQCAPGGARRADPAGRSAPLPPPPARSPHDSPRPPGPARFSRS